MSLQPGHRRGAAAVEFAIVAPLLFLIFLGMIEFSRAIMVLNVLTSASRAGVRAGAIAPGDYNAVTDTVGQSLTQAGIACAPAITVTVNGTTVADNTAFQNICTPGSRLAVQVAVPYDGVSWLPLGTSIFLRGRMLSETALMLKEG